MAAGDVLYTFQYTGSPSNYNVPPGITRIMVECWGASGGKGGGASGSQQGGAGGKGAYAKGFLDVTTGTRLEIYVGGQGTAANDSNSGGSGGGATDVRVGGTSLLNRIIVAAGGGGGTGYHGGWNLPGVFAAGGNGGGLQGDVGGYQGVLAAAGQGGTQTAGGASGSGNYNYSGQSGSLGTGGNGGNAYVLESFNGGGKGGNGYAGGGGGGGGYYGGGGGNSNSDRVGGGGGGSSYIGGVNGGVMTAGIREGHGMVVITDASNAPPTVTITNPVNNSEVNTLNGITVTWTYSDSEGTPQAAYEYGFKASADSEWIIEEVAGTGTSEHIPDFQFTEGGSYDFRVRVRDAGGVWSSYATTTFTTTTFTTLPEVNSSAPSGYINASALTEGTYEVRVRTSDGNGWSEWSDIKTQVLGPASNIYVKEGGTVKVAVKYVMVNGQLIATGPTKVGP